MTDAVFVGTVCTSPTGSLAQIQAEHLARRKRLGVVEQIQDFSKTLARLRAEVTGLEAIKQEILTELDAARGELKTLNKCLNRAREQNDFQLQPIRLIIKLTADYYEVSVTNMVGKNRDARISLPRHVAMYLAKIKTGQSYPDIGRRFGNRDHSTIHHGVRKIENRILVDPKLRDDMTELLSRIAFVESKEKTNAKPE